jgi:hypothetical protein
MILGIFLSAWPQCRHRTGLARKLLSICQIF